MSYAGGSDRKLQARPVSWGGKDYGIVTKDKVERAGLIWNDVLQKLIRNNHGFQESPTEVRLFTTIFGNGCLGSEEEVRASMSKVFGEDYSRLRPLLNQAFNVCSCCWQRSDITTQYYNKKLCRRCNKLRETRDSLISLKQRQYEFYQYKQCNKAWISRGKKKPLGGMPKKYSYAA